MSPPQKDKLKEVESAARSLANQLDRVTDSLEKFYSTGQKSQAKIGGTSTAVKDMANVVTTAAETLSKFTDVTGSAVAKLGTVGKVFGGALKTASLFTDAMKMAGEAAVSGTAFAVNFFDKQTSGLRAFDKEIFDINKRFGQSIDQSRQFADSLRMAGSNELAKSLNMTTNEMMDFVRATKGTSLTQRQLTEVVQTGAGAIELYGAATAFAASTNMSVSETAGIFNTLLNKQGKSAQEATNILGIYVGVAEDTGLAIDKVATSLNSAVDNFAKIGMAADFGAPILKGFASTMNEMGLGIENAIGLSTDLTGALASLTTKYDMAYLTFQRGGLDIGGGGGGGILGASIGLQSALLDAEKTGDQAAISDQLVRGMKDTLASFTGGDIVTVQQAAEDTSLQSQFYIQQQMLKSNFGIRDDQSAARVLDMLSQLDEATRMGDKDAQDKLKEQIENEAKGRDETLDVMEKISRSLEGQLNMAALNYRESLMQTRLFAEFVGVGVKDKVLDPMVKLTSKIPEASGDALQGTLEAVGISESEMYKQLGLEKGSTSAKMMQQIFDEQLQLDQLAASSADAEVVARASMGGNVSDQTLAGIAERGGLGISDESIDKLARVLADQVSKSTVDAAGGDKEDLSIMMASTLKEALSDISLKVDLTPRAAEALAVQQALGRSVQKVSSPGNPKR